MGVARTELISTGMVACRRRLEPMGFVRHRWDTYTLPLAPHLLGRVMLSRAVHCGDGSMLVTPLIGLLHQHVERLVATLARLPYHRYGPATVQTAVGQLTPGTTPLEVIFAPDEPVNHPADLVCEPIREYGLPWLRAHASLEAIDTLITSGQIPEGNYIFRLPVIAWLLGKPELARQRLDAHLAGPIWVIAEHAKADKELTPYERFALALEEHMTREAPPVPPPM